MHKKTFLFHFLKFLKGYRGFWVAALIWDEVLYNGKIFHMFVYLFVHLSVHSLRPPPLGHAPRPEAQAARPEAQPARSEAQTASWLGLKAGWRRGGNGQTDRWMNGWTDRKTNRRKERKYSHSISLLLGCFPAFPYKNQGKGAADHLMPSN